MKLSQKVTALSFANLELKAILRQWLKAVESDYQTDERLLLIKRTKDALEDSN